jgi:hypothetical protein
MAEMLPDSFDAAEVVTRETHRAAVALASSLAPRFMALTVKQTGDFVVPGTPTAPESSLFHRLVAREPVTALADPEVGQGRLGTFGQRPATGGDVLAGTDVDGRRVAAPLEQLCAIEAARLAPQLASDLSSQYPGIGARLSGQHGRGVAEASTSITPSVVLCAEVSAHLTVALIAAVTGEMAQVPIQATVARQ